MFRVANDNTEPTNAESQFALNRNPITGDICTINFNAGTESIQYKYGTSSWAVLNRYITGDIIKNLEGLDCAIETVTHIDFNTTLTAPPYKAGRVWYDQATNTLAYNNTVLGTTIHLGTNSTSTPTNGGVAYGTGTALAYTPTGSTGQFLTSAGGAPPTWTSATALAGAIGYYGAYHDTSTVTATSVTTAYVMNIGSTDLQNGVSIVSGTRLTVANAGIYNLQFSAQLSNPNSAIANVSIWLRINGVDVTDGAGTNGVPAKHGSNDGLQIISWNYILSLAAADYVELVWHSDTTGVQLITFPATTSPSVPQSPSLIVTIGAQSQIGIGYYGQTSLTSTTIGTGSKTFTVSIPATTTAFTIGTRVRFAYTTTPSNFMEGVITAFSNSTMTVLIDLIGGSGTYATWAVSVAGNQGTGAVTSVTATAPVASSGGTTPVISMAAATTSVNGYLTSTDWNTFNNKGSGTVTSVTGTTGRITSTGGVTPVIDLASGIATAGTTGSATLIPVVTIDTYGRVTGITTAANPQGTLTGLSVVSANGFAGTSNGGATPALTLSTSVTGILKGNGTAMSAAVANTDYVPLSTVLTKTADYTITNTDTWIINNKSGSAMVLTFPAASAWPGRSVTIKNLQVQAVNSATSNIVPIDSITAGTSILLPVIGNWATVVSDGTNWVTMAQAPNNILLLE